MNRRFMTAAAGAFVPAGGISAPGLASPAPGLASAAHITVKQRRSHACAAVTATRGRTPHADVTARPFIHTNDQAVGAPAMHGTQDDGARAPERREVGER